MNKILKSIFLIIISLGFLVGIVNAQELPFPFYVKFTDANENGTIDFTIYAINVRNQTLYTGIATTDHTTIYDPLLQIPAGGDNSTSVSWEVEPGKSLIIYDVYLTPNPDNINTYYWTSKGDAFLCRFGGIIGILISWEDTDVLESFSPQGDEIYGVRVPIPSALWLLGSGAITLGLIRKKLLIR